MARRIPALHPAGHPTALLCDFWAPSTRFSLLVPPSQPFSTLLKPTPVSSVHKWHVLWVAVHVARSEPPPLPVPPREDPRYHHFPYPGQWGPLGKYAVVEAMVMVCHEHGNDLVLQSNAMIVSGGHNRIWVRVNSPGPEGLPASLPRSQALSCASTPPSRTCPRTCPVPPAS